MSQKINYYVLPSHSPLSFEKTTARIIAKLVAENRTFPTIAQQDTTAPNALCQNTIIKQSMIKICVDSKDINKWDEYLWSYEQLSFLPHYIDNQNIDDIISESDETLKSQYACSISSNMEKAAKYAQNKSALLIIASMFGVNKISSEIITKIKGANFHLQGRANHDSIYILFSYFDNSKLEINRLVRACNTEHLTFTQAYNISNERFTTSASTEPMENLLEYGAFEAIMTLVFQFHKKFIDFEMDEKCLIQDSESSWHVLQLR